MLVMDFFKRYFCQRQNTGLVESLIGEGPMGQKRKSANQISVFQSLERNHENFKEVKRFQGLNTSIGRI